MASKVARIDIRAQRGTKRACQNRDCDARFYDLNRDPITCPICGSVYTVVAQTVPEAAVRAASRIVKKPAVVRDDIEKEVGAEPNGDEALVAEGGDEETVAADDDTFLEEVEEESPDVTAIVDAPIDPDEKS